MSDETNQDQGQGQATETESAPPPKTSTRRKAQSASSVPDVRMYISTQKHTYAPDIQVMGEVIAGAWGKSDGLVEYAVPNHLVDGFEKHFHFVSGNIVAAE